LRICKKIKPANINNANYYNVVGIVCRRLELLDEATWNSKKALEIDKNLVGAKMNIANVEFQKGDFKEAIKLLQVIVREEPSYHEAKANLALAYKNIGKIEKSLDIYRKLEYRDSWSSGARFNFAITNVTSGYFREGWDDYEYRWKVYPGNREIWPFEGKPLWKGEKGSRVVLWREQGIGDDIIFLSLAPEVQEMCSSLAVYVDPRLHSLCRRAMPEINFVNDIDELKGADSDYHLPLGSVPGLIRNDISDFDRTVTGYFKADPSRVESIRKELQLDGKIVIGISWKSFNALNKVKKSVQLRDMGRMFAGLDIVLVNLQYGDVDDEIKEFKEETGIDVVQCASVDNREDLDGLAALIEACDLVVSITNVSVHMAGALAKETWVLLPYVANFWWLLERTDSVWYPSLTLYRQPVLDDWDSVYASVRKDLETRLERN
jgi:tetratricopeptide (TPR) repeat protein